MKEEYLTEEKYNQSNNKVKKVGKVLIIIGLILLSIGVILIISGFLGFGSQITSGFENGQNGINPGGIFSGIGLFALGGFLTTPGLFLTMIGLMLRFLIGNRREISAYTTQQIMPIAQEGINKMAPTIGNAAKEITKGIKEGLESKDN